MFSPTGDEVHSNSKLCIICQTITSKSPIPSAIGRSKILDCAEGKRDIVYDRIVATNCRDTFLYHTGNECYKNYTRRTVLPSHTSELFENIGSADNAEAAEGTDSDI